MSKITWINNNVGFGPASSFGGPTLQELAGAGVSLVVDLNANQNEHALASKLGIEYLGEYVGDHTAPTQDQLFKLASILKRAVAQGRKVYVHCTAGVGRSPTCVAAYLISQSNTFEQAYARVKTKRSVAWTDSGAVSQLQALRDFERNMERAST